MLRTKEEYKQLSYHKCYNTIIKETLACKIFFTNFRALLLSGRCFFQRVTTRLGFTNNHEILSLLFLTAYYEKH